MPPAVAWRDEGGRLTPHCPRFPSRRIAWTPQPGSQLQFVRCKVTEALYEGARGPGKTDALLMSFARHVGVGHGQDWRGILFRRTYDELSDIVAKSRRWFSELFPRAKFNQVAHRWDFPDGEVLRMSYMAKPSDYYRYHGHQYTWIGWEELTNWPSDECYRLMFSTLRSTNPSVPRHVRATCNPHGVGHNWVKARFQLPAPHGRVTGGVIETEGEPDRIAFHGDISENKILLHSNPDYIEKLRASADTPAKFAAWVHGSWDIVAGGMFDDLWNPAIHVVPPIPPKMIPPSWRMDRSYDDGQARPFSVGFWAQSDGTPIKWEGVEIGTIRGDTLRFQEWYGWNGTANKGLGLTPREIALGIVERETLWGVRGRVRAGHADTAIFNADRRDPGLSVAHEMEKAGVSWLHAFKNPGSRKQGLVTIRQYLKQALPDANGRREAPGLFVSQVCKHFLRTIPVLPRDEKDPDDIDDESEDHVADETRYRLLRPGSVSTPVAYLPF